MVKNAKHKGMAMTEDELERWHKERRDLTPEQHEALMKKMRISEEEDKKWHKTHGIDHNTPEQSGQKAVNPFAIGGGFLSYCVRQGWLIQEGKGRNAKYYVTRNGEQEIKKFGITI